MFLPCQIARFEQDYEDHRNNMFYKKTVTTLNKRINRAAKRHKHRAIVYITDPYQYQIDILNTIRREYEDAGYVAEIKVIENSVDRYIHISW